MRRKITYIFIPEIKFNHVWMHVLMLHARQYDQAQLPQWAWALAHLGPLVLLSWDSQDPLLLQALLRPRLELLLPVS